MPSYIVKDKPDVDWYVMWSEIVDAPTFAGTRAEMEACHYFTPDDVAAQRFARADEFGTSAQWGADQPGREIFRPGGWDDTGFVYHQEGTLPRARLRELCDRLETDELADVSDLLEPFEDEGWERDAPEA